MTPPPEADALRRKIQKEIEAIVMGDKIMKLKKSVKFREEKFGGVLFETLGEKVYSLNETGAAVVRAIQNGASAPELAGRVAEHFEGSSDELAKDVADFVGCLRELQLLDE